MQVTLETTTGLERKMRISVPADELDTQIEAKIKQTAQQVRLKGFRPGKVPLREVKRRFGKGIQQEVSSELIQSSFSQAIKQESVAPAGAPEIADVIAEAGQNLEYTAIFEVFPDVEPGDFSSIQIEKPVCEIGEQDLDDMIDRLQQQRIEYAQVERAAAEEDKVNIDFEGLVDDESFDGNQAEGADIIIGSDSMIPGFEAALIGCSAGDEKDLQLSFPEKYNVEHLAGKPAVFKVKINGVSEPKVPELDEAFFASFGVDEGGVEAFRAAIRGNMQRELDRAVKQRTKTQVMDGLLDVTEVEAPRALVNSEIDRLRHDAVHQFGGHDKIDPSMLPTEMFESQAVQRVSLGLIINAVVDNSSLEVDEGKVRAAVEEMASAYDDPEQVVNLHYGNEQQLNQIRNMVLEEQVVDLVVDKANVTEVTMSYAEVLESLQTASAASSDESGDETGTS